MKKCIEKHGKNLRPTKNSEKCFTVKKCFRVGNEIKCNAIKLNSPLLYTVECPICGTFNKKHAGRCMGCGEPIEGNL